MNPPPPPSPVSLLLSVCHVEGGGGFGFLFLLSLNIHRSREKVLSNNLIIIHIADLGAHRRAEDHDYYDHICTARIIIRCVHTGRIAIVLVEDEFFSAGQPEGGGKEEKLIKDCI
jgi:hypothetical protein